MMFHALSRSALALYTVALLGTAASSMPAQAAHKEARVRAKVVANRIVVRCQLTSKVATMPAYLFLSYDRLCGLELHNQATNALDIEKDGRFTPVTLGFPGIDIEVPRREHGDEDELNEFTKLYSPDLEEIGVLGSIGANLLKDYYVTFDLAHGLIKIATPKEETDLEPDGPEEIYTRVDATSKLVWLPVKLRGEHRRVVGIGGHQYDSVIDELLCEEFGQYGGNIGTVEMAGFDLNKVVPWRPEELPYAHEDGALGILGINFLENFRVEIDRVNGWVGLTRTKEGAFPVEERAFFEARATEEVAPLHAWLKANQKSRLAPTAASSLLVLHMDHGSPLAQLTDAIGWVDQTQHPNLRATKAIDTMRILMQARLGDAAVVAGRHGIKGGRADRYPGSVHRLHVRLGEILLAANRNREAWEHLMAAAFGLHEAIGATDQAKVNLLLGEYYERDKRYKRAMSRYVQAVVTPEAGERAIAALTRLQHTMGGEVFSWQLVDRLISGKVRSMTAPTKFVADPNADTSRTVLIEHVTNPHIGRKRGETWRAWTEGGSMVFQGLQTHFPRERVVMLGYHGVAPRPVGISNALSVRAANRLARGRWAFCVDGHRIVNGAMEYHQADQGYDILKKFVTRTLGAPSDYKIQVEAQLSGDRVVGSTSVHGPHTDDVHVEVILAEKGVLYPGLGATVVHRMVARAPLTDSLDGVALDPAKEMTKVAFGRSLAAIEKANRKFLDEYEEKARSIATRLSVGMARDQLVVIVCLRDQGTGDVLQAAQADVSTTGN
jgi:hypothetical protein